MVEFGVHRLVGDAHAALAEFFQNFVMRNCFADHDFFPKLTEILYGHTSSKRLHITGAAVFRKTYKLPIHAPRDSVQVDVLIS